MKYRKRLACCVLLAGLMVLINSCGKKKAGVQLLRYQAVKDFPSASAIEHDAGRLYIFGDDASYLLVMDTGYKRVDTIYYSTDTTYRIAKSTKADIESATLIHHNNSRHLYALGSLSNASRSTLFYFPLQDPHTYLSIDYSPFAQQLSAIPEINIEGMSFVQSRLVFANRANRRHKTNRLIIGGQNLYEYKSVQPEVIQLDMDSSTAIGISGLYYVEEKDLLLFTASEENTASAIADGSINDSYLGYITRFSTKITDKVIAPNELIKLTTIDPAFRKQKIESVCLERIEGDSMILHLVADNDDGASSLFRIRFAL